MVTSAALRAARAARGGAAVELGRTAEGIAADFLGSQGLRMELRNFRCRAGEIDLVARDEGTLVVVEVRTRLNDRYGGAAGSIDSRKQRRIVLATRVLLHRHRKLARLKVRFDVVIVANVFAETPHVQWIRQAF